ncbi:unnamed protein product [Durusdinium trenchii]|uniref:Uncharacterized protein n=1 Tax=Durusdinium trenchii TaxID=1381693 RepID=A0ABP0K899_9DINO
MYAKVQRQNLDVLRLFASCGNDCNVEKLEKAEVFDELQPLVEELQWSLEAQEQKLEELLTTERRPKLRPSSARPAAPRTGDDAERTGLQSHCWQVGEKSSNFWTPGGWEGVSRVGEALWRTCTKLAVAKEEKRTEAAHEALLKLRSVAAGGAVGAPETRAPVEGTRSWAMSPGVAVQRAKASDLLLKALKKSSEPEPS